MSSASPDDLVVTFRSVPRRLRESQGNTPDDEFNRLSAELRRLVGEAGGLFGTAPDAVLVADAIAATRADAWDEATLAHLRELALGIGQQLRTLTAAGER